MPRKSSSRVQEAVPLTMLLSVALTALVIYLPSIFCGFTFDDGVIVARNPAVQEWGHWRLIFFSDYWPGIHSALYRPVTILSFALGRLIHGSAPAGFHLLNIMLHAGVSVLVCLLAAMISARNWVGLLGGLIFAVQPIHTEAVSSIVGRAELLSSCLALLALLLYLRRVQSRRLTRPGLAAILLLYFLAIGAKENVVVMPVLLLLWYATRTSSMSFGPTDLRLPVIRHFLLFVATAALFILIRSAALGGMIASFSTNPPFVENPIASEPASVRVLNALAYQARGLALNIVPRPLIVDYSFRTLPTLSNWWNIGTIAFLTFSAFTAVLWVFRNQTCRNLACCFSWYLLAILPASNIPFPVGTIFAERLFYFPSVGLCIAAGVLLAGIGRIVPRPCVGRLRINVWVLTISSAVLLALCAVTLTRQAVWQNDMALFKDAVAKAPQNVKARLWLGDSLVQERKFEDAIAEYRKALEIYPKYGAANANLMVPLMQLHRYREAIEAGEAARSLFPAENSSLFYNLALACLENGDTVQFLDYIDRVIRLDPGNTSAHLQLGMYYWRQAGDRASGRKQLEEVLRLDPALPEGPGIRQMLREAD